MAAKSFNIFTKKNLPENIRGVSLEEDTEILLNQCKANHIVVDPKRIKKAIELDYDVYKDAIDVNNSPRYLHSIFVAMIVAKEIPLDEDSILAAILHDIWENDDKYDYDYINKTFGKTVADIVDGLHKIHTLNIESLDNPENVENYRKLLIAIASDFRIILIKLADTLQNMRNIDYYKPEVQRRLAQETFEIYTPFANRLGLRNLKWELDDLAFKILNPKEYNDIVNYLSESKEKREDFIKKFIEPIKEKLDKDDFLKRNKISYEVYGRAKHIFSIYNKMRLRQKNIDELFDLFAIRVVLNTHDPNMCFYVYGLVSQIYPPVPETFKDYISVPKKNGYQSLHTAVFGINGKIVEIQIRTLAMHEYAENGVAAHFKYKTHLTKNSILEKEEIQQWIGVVREIFENHQAVNTQQLLDSVRSNLFSDEIYVYTPTNEFITLPVNSTPLDFAYKIHSEIGNHFVGAKVNGKMVPIDYQLRNGDKIEVIVSNKAKPEEDWLNYVITSKASNEIQKFFKEEARRKEQIGKDRWKKELDRRKFFIDNNRLLNLLSEFNIHNITDFYIAIADESIDVSSFAEFVVDSLFSPEREKVFKKSTDESEFVTLLKEIPKEENSNVNDKIFIEINENVKKFALSFTGKENYSLISQISQLVLNTNNIILTKFVYDLEKSKINGEIHIESEEIETVKSLFESIKKVPGIVYVNEFFEK